jgi:hypothetical protein
MGKELEQLFNPCRAPKAQRLPAKIWELLRRNESFRLEVKKLHALDKRAKQETVNYGGIARQYNKAIAEKDTALIAEWQARYDAVKDRPIRRKSPRVIDAHQKMHPLVALALTWLVPEPLFAACRQRNGQIEEGTGLSPDLNHPSWKWWKSNEPQGAIGHDIVRGPEIGRNFEEWQNWRPGLTLFDCATFWNRLPKSFKSEFVRVWRRCYDSQDAYEFKYLPPPRNTDNLTRDDFARYLDFWETVTHRRLFAVSLAILTTKDVGEVFARLQNRIKRRLPESRDYLFGTEAAWRHYLAITERKLSLARYIIGPGYKSKDSTEINEAVRNRRRNVQFGVKAIEKMISLVYPTFELKKIVVVHSAPRRDKMKRRKPLTVVSAQKSET